MIDLGIFGVLQVQGSLYLPVLLAALIFCGLKRDFWGIGAITLLGWLGTRLIDMGGAVGNFLISTAETEQMAVASIGMGLAGLDLWLIVLLALFCRHLKLTVLLIALYACMLPFYSLAIVGWMEGATALGFVNLLGLLKLALIITSGGIALVYDRRGWTARHPIIIRFLDTVAPWVVTKEAISGDNQARGTVRP